MSFREEIERDRKRGGLAEIGSSCVVAGTSCTGSRSSLMRGEPIQFGGRMATIEFTLFVLVENFASEPGIGKIATVDGTEYKIALVTKTPSGAAYQIACIGKNQ